MSDAALTFVTSNTPDFGHQRANKTMKHRRDSIHRLHLGGHVGCLAIALLFGAAACGGSTPDETTPASGAASSGTARGAAATGCGAATPGSSATSGAGGSSVTASGPSSSSGNASTGGVGGSSAATGSSTS